MSQHEISEKSNLLIEEKYNSANKNIAFDDSLLAKYYNRQESEETFITDANKKEDKKEIV